MKVVPNQLLEAASAVRSQAYAPYSHFFVGAALQLDSGMIVTGVNVENCSYGLTLCAERSAVVQAVAVHGLRPGGIVGIAVVLDAASMGTPCGACRQVLIEFAAPGTPVWMHNLRDGKTECLTVGELLPAAFSPASLA